MKITDRRKFLTLSAGVGIALCITMAVRTGEPIPLTWDLNAINKFHLPPPDTTVTIAFASADYYDSLIEHIIYKTFPVYVRGNEREGYLDSLRTLSPEIAFDLIKIKTEEDWIKAGESVFNWPVAYSPGVVPTITRDQVTVSGAKLLPNGIYGPLRYTILEKGKVLTGSLSCAACHTHVLESGDVVVGGQGNIVSSAGLVSAILSESIPFPAFKMGTKKLSHSPWAKNLIDSPDTKEDAADYFTAMKPGMVDRQGGAYLYPLSIPSLIGVKDIRYLDHTGLMMHNGPADMMRYAAFNQGMDMLTSFSGYIPGINETKLTTNAKWTHPFGYARRRYSDAQLYALTKYIYSLAPPPNPVKYPRQLIEKGKAIFAREGCVTCHTPPLYTNNKLTPASGFTPPPDHYVSYDIFNVSVETDSVSTLYSRRGTGYYKVPSLRGVWFRNAFFHNGNVTSLEEVLDSNRLDSKYIPRGYKPPALKSMAVKGHPFGLTINENEKRALIAFLKTL